MLSAYQLHEAIGRGASSVVHRATRRANGSCVAVKLGAARALSRERLALERVSHPNVLRALDSGAGFIVLELIDGMTLTQHIRLHGPLSQREAIGIALGMTAGLAALHACGVVHRDLKPSNVMLSRSGSVVLIDLGIARIDREDEPQRGTHGFASPEQERGEEVDERSDLYSLGCVLAAMLAGRAALRPLLPAGLARLCAEDRTERPASAHEAHDLLSCWIR